MKAKWIALRLRSLVPWMIASFMVLANYGCEEPEIDLPEECLFGDINSESFAVFPGGSVIQSLDGIVTLEFPKRSCYGTDQVHPFLIFFGSQCRVWIQFNAYYYIPAT